MAVLRRKSTVRKSLPFAVVLHFFVPCKLFFFAELNGVLSKVLHGRARNLPDEAEGIN